MMEAVLATVAAVALSVQTLAVLLVAWRLLGPAPTSKSCEASQPQGDASTPGSDRLLQGFENLMTYAARGKTGVAQGEDDDEDG